jgi:polyphosphate kinase
LEAVCTNNPVYSVELSWLSFNWRVLSMAMDPATPAYERLRFLAISASNLDEFFGKRVGGMKRQQAAQQMRKLKTTKEGMWSPERHLEIVSGHVRDYVREQNRLLREEILPALEGHGVQVVSNVGDLEEEEQRRLEKYFQDELELLLTPIKLDPGHPFPFLRTMDIGIAAMLLDQRNSRPSYAVVTLPTNVPRWVRVKLPGENNGYIALEHIIVQNLGRLFGGWEILGAYPFRVTRNAEIERHEEEAEDLMDMISEEVRMRQFAPFVRLQVSADTPEHLTTVLAEELDLSLETDVYREEGMLDLVNIADLKPKQMSPEILFDDFEGHVPSRLRRTNPDALGAMEAGEFGSKKESIFSIIRKGDVLLHHPYQSFGSSTLQFFREAATDPNVVAIKATLYRTSSDSPVIDALIRAAANGKQVAVLVELKARFDEARNVGFATRLEQAGCNVAYGLIGLKTHSKTTLVVRKEASAPSGLRTYVHIATGNYNPVTAGIYTDFGLLSSDPALGLDVVDVFKHLTGLHLQSAVGGYRKLLVANVYMKKQFLELIENEIQNAKRGLRAAVLVKVNGLDDVDLVEKLYEASSAGVRVDAIVRGVCRLRPGVKGLSENIRVVSIVGRFLEHHRVYVFHNAGSPKYFFGSADWMTRNLQRRVEVAAPIEDPELKLRVRNILTTFLCDCQNAFEMQPEGHYVKPATRCGEALESAPFALGEAPTDTLERMMAASRERGCQQAIIERHIEDDNL